MYDGQDTIAAISTATAPAGIGIIRVSGPKAIPVCHGMFVNRQGEQVLEQFAASSFHYGFVTDPAGEKLDEVMCAVMRAPHSYTGEDVVEIQCHGGLLNLQRILESVLTADVRLAEPGEFTKRAFLNGRIDLTQAEAVMDIIAADNDLALKSARRQANGQVSDRIRPIRAALLSETAFIEAALDDPESYGEELVPRRKQLLNVLDDSLSAIDKLLAGADEGILIREGVKTAIIGMPNAGKSSILNLLSGRERSIVSDIPGTTRDTVEEKIRLGKVTLHLIDTAGITGAPENTADPIERIGMERAELALNEAQLILFVVDADRGITTEVRTLFEKTQGKRRIVLYNKTDLLRETEKETGEALAEAFSDTPVILFSAVTGEGQEELKNLLSAMLLGETGSSEEMIITHVRHRKLLQEAAASLKEVKHTIDKGLTEDFYTVDLMNAYRALGEIIGEEIGDDLVDTIFSEFCMGK